MSAWTIDMLSGSTITADGVTDWFKVPTVTMAALLAEVVSGAGTIAGFDLWLQYKTSASASTAFDVVLDHQLKTADAAASGTVNSNVRDLIDNKTTTTAETFYGLIKHLAGQYVRLKWKISGAGATAVVNCSLVGK